MPINTVAPTTDCIIIFDTDEQRYLFISPAIINILGITAAQLLGNNRLWPDMISQTQRGDIETAVASLAVNDRIELNYLINTPQNTTRRIIDKKSLVIDEATNHKVLVSAISVQVPLTADDAAEGSIFGDLFYKNANPVWIVDIQTLRFVKVNHAATVHYGYTEDEFLLLTLSDIRPTDEIGNLKTYLSNNENFEISADDFNRAGIWKHSGKSGQIIYADVNWFGIKYKGRNCILSIAADVTAKLQYQDEARRREQFLSSLIDSQTNFLIRIDIKGCYSFINKQFLKTFGYKENELIGSIFQLPRYRRSCICAKRPLLTV